MERDGGASRKFSIIEPSGCGCGHDHGTRHGLHQGGGPVVLSPGESLKEVADVLNGNGLTVRDISDGVKAEMIRNFRPEIYCILACEFGEKFAEFAFYLLGMKNWNLMALPAGIAAGFGYAVWHVLKHAKQHDSKADFGEALQYAATAESGCVVSATTAEWVAGNYVNADSPFDANSLGVSAVALPGAFAIGLFVMSVVSYIRKGKFVKGTTDFEKFCDTLSGLNGDLTNLDLSCVMGGVKKPGAEIRGKSGRIRFALGKRPSHVEMADNHAFVAGVSSFSTYAGLPIFKKFAKELGINPIEDIYECSH